jgi:hypothetical protein
MSRKTGGDVSARRLGATLNLDHQLNHNQRQKKAPCLSTGFLLMLSQFIQFAGTGNARAVLSTPSRPPKTVSSSTCVAT